MEAVAVIDFETTGMSPEMGDRATEVAVVIVENGAIVDRYQSLMNTGAYISSFIEVLTGISNDMTGSAPPAAQVMRELAEFAGHLPLVAHNAAFDCRFLDAEWARVGFERQRQFACSMLLARRLYPDAQNHKLGTLVHHLGLPQAARHHRALADAEMTACLWLRMVDDIARLHGLCDVTHPQLCELQQIPKAKFAARIAKAAR